MGIFQVFSHFRRLTEAVLALVEVLQAIVDTQRELGPALERLNALEVSRHQFQAECEGLLLRSENKFKAAANAEARERQLKKSYEKNLGPFDEAGEDGEAPIGSPVLENDVAAGEAEGLQAMPVALAPNNKTQALRFKWHGTQ